MAEEPSQKSEALQERNQDEGLQEGIEKWLDRTSRETTESDSYGLQPHDAVHPIVMSDKIESRASSLSSISQRLDDTPAVAQHGESEDTGVVISSPRSDSVLIRHEHYLSGSDSEAEQQDEAEDDHSGIGTASVEGSDEDETELVVLDPDHPLMKRFQITLKNYLLKQLEKLDLDVKEMSEQMKKRKVDREELGVVLYGVQQELAHMQMALEKHHDRCGGVAVLRRQLEEELENIRNLYRKTQLTTNEERKKVAELQTEVDNMALRLFYTQNLNEDVRSDIAVMKRATQKAEAERTQAEQQKMKQDLFVDRLTKQVERLNEQTAMYEAQIIAQAEESKAAKNTVTEAQMEIDAINMEKKQLLQQWNTSLIGMRRRDEAYAAMEEALSQARQQVQSLDTEIEVYKKSIIKEEEQNELLAVILNRAESDAAMSKKLIAQCQMKQDALKAEYSTYTRTLHETEQALNRISLERATRLNELTTLRKKIENEYLTRTELEDKLMEKMQECLTLDKATKYSNQLIYKLRAKKREQEMKLAKGENEVAQITLENNHSSTRLSMLRKTLSELDKMLGQKNSLISNCEIEIEKRNILIERKQGTINLYNKKIEQALSSAGGKELGPLEMQIKAFTKQVEERSTEIMELQQYWLRLQNDLVKLTREREEQATSVEMLKKQLTILQQKKIRTENGIQQELNEKKDIERHMRNLSNDMLKLNMLLSKNSASKDELEQGNILMETEFLRGLREAEKESVELQEKLHQLKEEKERLLINLVEAERQILLWEKKSQLAKETRDAVDSDVGQGEIRIMRAEIHRMEVRYAQLMKQQEKMIRDMEAVVSRRETIVTRAEGQAKMDKKLPTRSEFQNKLLDLKKKIKESQKNADECNGIIRELQDQQNSLSKALSEKQQQCSAQRAVSDQLDVDLEKLQENKQRNLSQIVAYQTRLKHLQAVKDEKYTPLCKTEQALENEKQKQEDRIHIVSSIMDRIQQEYPQYQGTLRQVSLVLASRLRE
ncbi:coiled-coil domain-containing protein 40 [Protopterus annectens]|uniref:coiled-coil domain-containing protein 40 n=1 Tax=Protopterus annectens TaxID=7888 RepID=UPI001CF996B6|nr:coiled-coil domain-containing protein 40 [Protopterus annectens]